MRDDDINPVEVDDDEADDELGYAECDWSRLPAKSIDAHDRIIGLDYEQLEELDIDALDDLGKWAAAQGFWDFGDEDRFHDIALRIVRSKNRHAAINYVEVCMELVSDYLLEARWDELVFLLPDVERLVTDDDTIRARLGAMVSVGRGRVDEGMAVFQELAEAHESDGDVLLLLAHDLFSVDQDEAAFSMLDAAEDAASIADDRDILDEIAALRADLAAGDAEA